MKFSRNTLLMLIALAIFLVAVRVAIADKAEWGALAQRKKARDEAEQSLHEARTMQSIIVHRIPPGEHPVQPIGPAAVYGTVSLYRLALAHHLRVGMMSVQGIPPGKVDLEQVAQPVPGTDGGIKRISFRFKAAFTDVAFLGDFIAQIPQTGGYLSAIEIREGNASLIVNFLGA